jgi:hypothetical protein
MPKNSDPSSNLLFAGQLAGMIYIQIRLPLNPKEVSMRLYFPREFSLPSHPPVVFVTPGSDAG